MHLIYCRNAFESSQTARFIIDAEGLVEIYITSGINSAFGGYSVCEVPPVPVSYGARVNGLPISVAAHNTLHCGRHLGHVSVIEVKSDASGRVSSKY